MTTAPPIDGERAFVPAWADRTERFFERVLVHTKGRHARHPFKLTEWQRDDLVRPIFGTARYDAQLDDWVRAYSEVWIELGRGNGKSEFIAGSGLKLLIDDGEEAAEIYGAAKDRDQAAIVYAVMKRMVELSPTLQTMVDRKILRVVDSKKTIIYTPTDSFYRVIAADADGNLGQNPHGILFDEVISQPSRELWDALQSGLGKRDQGLMIAATTAGNDPESFAKVEHDAAVAILEDPAKAPHRYVYIRNTPADADPWNENNWHHANPALASGFLSIARLRQEARAAQSDPQKENAFRQFRLNQWVQQSTRWMPLHIWDKAGGLVVAERLLERPTPPFGGLDLAATSDLASLALLFPPETGVDVDPELPDPHRIPVTWKYWVPRAKVAELDKLTGGRFDVWVRQGFVDVAGEEVIDYDEIHETLDQARRDFGLRDLSLDLWNSSTTASWCEENGIETVGVPQTYRALSPPMKETYRLVQTAALNHGGNPVTRWNVDAVEVVRDPAENIRPVKPNRQRSGKRIDGFVALILAVDGWLRRGNAEVIRSAYEDHDVDVV